MADTRQLVFDMFRSLGVPPQAALGAMYSLGGESGYGFNTKAYNPNDPGGSFGIGQWNRGRKDALVALAGQLGLRPEDPRAQVAFLKQELTGPVYSGVLNQLRSTTDTNAAAHIWTKGYEAPKVDNSAQRIAGGAQVGSLDAQGNFVLGKPGSPGASGAGPVLASAATPPGPPAPIDFSAIAGMGGGGASLPAAPAQQSAGLDTRAMDSANAQDKQAQSSLLASMGQVPSASQIAQPTPAPGAPAAGAPRAPGAPGQLADIFKVADIGQAAQLRPPTSPRFL
jgi:hypothetical protein